MIGVQADDFFLLAEQARPPAFDLDVRQQSPHVFTCGVCPGIGVLYQYLIVFILLFIIRWLFISRIQVGVELVSIHFFVALKAEDQSL